MSRKAVKSQALLFAAELALFFLFLALNFKTPLMGEDYALLSFYPSENIHFGIELFSKMGARILLQINGWNVRVGEQLSIFWGCFDKHHFDFFNSLMFLYFLFLIRIYAFKNNYRTREALISLFTSVVLLFLFQPAFGEIFFWKTGSTNYLWAICLLLTFALPLRFYIGAECIDIIGNSKAKQLLFTFLGFFAGVTNENTVGTFWLLYLFVVFISFVQKKSLPHWIYSTFLSYTAGFVYMLKAPSTAIRMAYYKSAYNIGSLTLKDYLNRATAIIFSFFSANYAYVLICLIFLLISFYINEKNHAVDRLHFSESLLFLLLSSLSCGALILSPYIELRAFLLTDFMLLVCISYHLNYIISYASKMLQKIFYGAGFLTAVCFFMTASSIYNEYCNYYSFCKTREQSILQSSDAVVSWEVYHGTIASRTLNTREDYLQYNTEYLERYYGKRISINEASSSQ